MVRMLWFSLLAWKRLESLLDSYKVGLAARSQHLTQGLGLVKDLLGDADWRGLWSLVKDGWGK